MRAARREKERLLTVTATRLSPSEIEWMDGTIDRLQADLEARGLRIGRASFFRACLQFVKKNEGEFLEFLK